MVRGLIIFHQSVVLNDITGHLGGKAGGRTKNEASRNSNEKLELLLFRLKSWFIHMHFSTQCRAPSLASMVRNNFERSAFRGEDCLIFFSFSACVLRCSQSNWLPYGCFQGGKPPKWMVKIMENPIKMDDLGAPLFLETPISFLSGRPTVAYFISNSTVRTLSWKAGFFSWPIPPLVMKRAAPKLNNL